MWLPKLSFYVAYESTTRFPPIISDLFVAVYPEVDLHNCSFVMSLFYFLNSMLGKFSIL